MKLLVDQLFDNSLLRLWKTGADIFVHCSEDDDRTMVSKLGNLSGQLMDCKYYNFCNWFSSSYLHMQLSRMSTH